MISPVAIGTSRSRQAFAPAGRVAAAVAIALVASGCFGQSPPTPTPSIPRPSASPRSARPPTPFPVVTTLPTHITPVPDVGCAEIEASKTGPYPEPTIPPGPSPTIAGADDQSLAAIDRAFAALTALRSYQASVDVIGRAVIDLQPSSLDFALRGPVSHADGFAMDALVGTRMRETNGTGASITSGSRYVVGGGHVWAVDNISEVLEPLPGDATPQSMVLLSPEGIADRFVVPFGGGYRRIGPEMHSGIRTVHYRASPSGIKAYAAALQFKGKLTADLWIAADGGQLSGLRIAGTASRVDPSSGLKFDDTVLIAFDVSEANDKANAVKLPVVPVADPPRPSQAPVDLGLEYAVVPNNGNPTQADVDAIGVALRTRLDISNRPVKVDTVDERVFVTVCRTTQPDEDRRLIMSMGALTVVPLPAADYGTAASPGGATLPAVGDPIDPALEPIAPAAGLGLTRAHVDPTTGRRGLAFVLGNQASATFQAYAAAHPGEYVAVVLDGVVLATLTIDSQVAKGHFVFTGDYTEAETRLMASYLYRDPLPFALRLMSDLEIPSP